LWWPVKRIFSDFNDGAIFLWTECCNGNQILIKQISANGILGEVVTNIHNEVTTIPNQIELYQNYPNPFNPSTTISFNIGKSTKVSLKVFNTLGMEIITLLDKRINRGSYKIPLALESMASGIYYYQLKIDDQTKTKKMLLIR
jgi:Secretion system C-terminal sorting domain